MTGFSGAMPSLQNSFLGADGVVGPKVRAWFAVETWPRYEKKVANELAQKSVDTFLPVQPQSRQWSDRRQTVHLPLFPNYVFVRISHATESRVPVLRTNGVRKFVGANHAGSPLEDSEIDSIRLLVGLGVPLQSHPFLNIGQRVRIRGGSLDGLEGILSAKNRDLSLVISIKLIQRSLAVELSGYQVEPF